jgi:hypothetical protein
MGNSTGATASGKRATIQKRVYSKPHIGYSPSRRCQLPSHENRFPRTSRLTRDDLFQTSQNSEHATEPRPQYDDVGDDGVFPTTSTNRQGSHRVTKTATTTVLDVFRQETTWRSHSAPLTSFRSTSFTNVRRTVDGTNTLEELLRAVDSTRRTPSFGQTRTVLKTTNFVSTFTYVVSHRHLTTK